MLRVLPYQNENYKKRKKLEENLDIEMMNKCDNVEHC